MADLSERLRARIDEIGERIESAQRRLPTLGTIASTAERLADDLPRHASDRLQQLTASGELYDRFHAAVGEVRGGAPGAPTDQEIGMALTMVFADELKWIREMMTSLAKGHRADELRTEATIAALEAERLALHSILTAPDPPSEQAAEAAP